MATKLNISDFLDQDEKKDLLRLLTAGSVDDGKSTLIGRLLFDSKKLYEDQLDALERDSKRVGNAGDNIDYALLLDGLKAEREQGITIDVAYRYFSTNKRKFIIADTPGHEQYTRNMITGGSTANLAIILVDARTGVITQTRRHTYLVSLLGIKHVVLAVNKIIHKDLLKAHKLMMNDLVKENGRFRNGGVGIFDGNKLIHTAPPANYVPQLISDLFEWYKQSPLHILIKSCIFHYEFEFIHPFADGNGRIGRMWHTLLLSQWNKLFSWLPIEELIKERQQEYYDALAISDNKADCTVFVEMMMQIIFDALNDLDTTDQVSDQVSDQVEILLNCMGNEVLSATQLMQRLGLSHRPTFRKNYLNPALKNGLIEMTIPDKPNSKNQKYRKK